MGRILVYLLFASTCLGQVQLSGIADLSTLVGKRVIVQRGAFCTPGAYNFSIAFSGKPGKVISVKPPNIPRVSEAALSRLNPDTRALLEDQQKAATILIQLDDGTKIDTCLPISPKRLDDYFVLAPGETLPVVEHPGSDSSRQPLASGAVPASKSPGAETKVTVPEPAASNVSTEGASYAPARTPTRDSVKVGTKATAQLSESEVSAAIRGVGREHWVTILDMGLSATGGNQWPSISLYMPEAMLAIQAESARRQFLKYDPTDEEKRRLLTIVAEGYAGKTITDGCTSITRIVLLSDKSGRVIKEANESEPLPEVWRNNLGATNQCQALEAKFLIEDVASVKAVATDGEFFVAVFSGSVNTKMYKVKKKFQNKLGL